jgi:hypothetical protein
MLQKHLDVIHLEKITDGRIKLIIVFFFHFFSKIKYYVFVVQFKIINLLENYENKIKKKNNFFFKNLKKNKKSLLIVCNSKESLKLQNKKICNHDIIVVNDFFLSKLSRNIIPNYYLSLHPFEGGNKFNSVNDKKLFLNKFMNYIVKNKTTKFFFDPSFKLFFGNKKNIYYLNISSIPLCYFHDINKVNIEKKIPAVGNIALACVIFGAYLNYTNIKLTGYSIDFFVGNLAGHNLKNHNHTERKVTVLDSPGSDDDFWMLGYIYSGWLIVKKLLQNKGIKFETNIAYSKLYLFKKN